MYWRWASSMTLSDLRAVVMIGGLLTSTLFALPTLR
jgi:Cu/Ag efflux pump CusA